MAEHTIKTTMSETGPVHEKRLAVNNGTSISPNAAPTTKMLAILPVRGTYDSARFIALGNTDDINNPYMIAPIHSIALT